MIIEVCYVLYTMRQAHTSDIFYIYNFFQSVNPLGYPMVANYLFMVVLIHSRMVGSATRVNNDGERQPTNLPG